MQAEVIAAHGFDPNEERDARGKRIPARTREAFSRWLVPGSARAYRDDHEYRRSLARHNRNGAMKALDYLRDTRTDGPTRDPFFRRAVWETIERDADAAPLYLRLDVRPAVLQVRDTMASYRKPSPRDSRPRLRDTRPPRGVPSGRLLEAWRRANEAEERRFENALSAWEAKKDEWYDKQKEARRASTPVRRAHRAFAVALGAVVAVTLVAHAGISIDAHDHDVLAALVGIEPFEWAHLYERAHAAYAKCKPRRRVTKTKRKRPGVRKRER